MGYNAVARQGLQLMKQGLKLFHAVCELQRSLWKRQVNNCLAWMASLCFETNRRSLSNDDFVLKFFKLSSMKGIKIVSIT